MGDVASLKNLFRLAGRLYPPLRRVGDPVGILDDIQEYTLSELDLRHEVAGQKELICLYEAHRSRFDLSSLAFPRLYEEYSNQDIMVAEHVSGETFDELLEAGRLPYERLIELFRIHGYYMFCLGVFHGDLHPGNVILAGDKLCLWIPATSAGWATRSGAGCLTFSRRCPCLIIPGARRV